MYADQLKNLVGAAAAEDDVRLSFKGGVVFVEFDRRKQQQGRLGGDLVSTGEISSQVGLCFELWNLENLLNQFFVAV